MAFTFREGVDKVHSETRTTIHADGAFHVVHASNRTALVPVGDP